MSYRMSRMKGINTPHLDLCLSPLSLSLSLTLSELASSLKNGVHLKTKYPNKTLESSLTSEINSVLYKSCFTKRPILQPNTIRSNMESSNSLFQESSCPPSSLVTGRVDTVLFVSARVSLLQPRYPLPGAGQGPTDRRHTGQ